MKSTAFSCNELLFSKVHSKVHSTVHSKGHSKVLVERSDYLSSSPGQPPGRKSAMYLLLGNSKCLHENLCTELLEEINKYRN